MFDNYGFEGGLTDWNLLWTTPVLTHRLGEWIDGDYVPPDPLPLVYIPPVTAQTGSGLVAGVYISNPDLPVADQAVLLYFQSGAFEVSSGPGDPPMNIGCSMSYQQAHCWLVGDEYVVTTVAAPIATHSVNLGVDFFPTVDGSGAPWSYHLNTVSNIDEWFEYLREVVVPDGALTARFTVAVTLSGLEWAVVGASGAPEGGVLQAWRHGICFDDFVAEPAEVYVNGKLYLKLPEGDGWPERWRLISRTGGETDEYHRSGALRLRVDTEGYDHWSWHQESGTLPFLLKMPDLSYQAAIYFRGESYYDPEVAWGVYWYGTETHTWVPFEGTYINIRIEGRTLTWRSWLNYGFPITGYSFVESGTKGINYSSTTRQFTYLGHYNSSDMWTMQVLLYYKTYGFPDFEWHETYAIAVEPWASMCPLIT